MLFAVGAALVKPGVQGAALTEDTQKTSLVRDWMVQSEHWSEHAQYHEEWLRIRVSKIGQN